MELPVEIAWLIVAGQVCLLCAVVCAYYEMKYRRCKLHLDKVVDAYDNLVRIREDQIKIESFRRNKMHRRAQRAEAERDRALRYGTLRLAEDLVDVHDLFKLRKWYKQSGYYHQERLYENSKDTIVKDIAKFMLESYERRS